MPDAPLLPTAALFVLRHRGGTLAPAFDPGTTELRQDGDPVGLAFVQATAGGWTEDMLVHADAKLVAAPSPSGSARADVVAAPAVSGSPGDPPFDDRQDFLENAWDRLGWSTPTEAVHQLASTATQTVELADLEAFCEDLAATAQGGRVVVVKGTRPAAGGPEAVEGLLVFEASAGSNPFSRTVHQLVPATMSIAPEGSLTLEDQGFADSAQDLETALLDWAQGADGDVIYAESSCTLAQIDDPGDMIA